MEIIAQGKDAMLGLLESESQKRTGGGKPGEYMMAKDNDGQLFVCIAGHTFLGTGFVNLDGQRLVVADGIVSNVQTTP